MIDLEKDVKVGDTVIVTNMLYGHGFEMGEEIKIIGIRLSVGDVTAIGKLGLRWALRVDEFKLKEN